MSRARSGRGKGRQQVSGNGPALTSGVSDDLERLRRISNPEGIVHPGGIELESYPVLSGDAVDDDWLAFPKRAIVWRRGDNGQRIAYVHAHGAPSPLAGSDFSILEMAAKQYDNGAVARSKMELMVGDTAAQIRANVHHTTAGSPGTKTLLDAAGLSHWLFDKDNGVALQDGHLQGTVCSWSFGVPADANFRFHSSAPGAILDTQSPGGAAADGLVFFRKTGVYMVVVRGHTLTGGAWQAAVFNNSVGYLTSCGGIVALGNDGLGHIASTTEFRRYGAGEHIRVGGWHTGGGTLNVILSVYRLPF